jgi:hypothetical protein
MIENYPLGDRIRARNIAVSCCGKRTSETNLRGVEASDFVIPIGKTAETGDEYLTSHPKERQKTRIERPQQRKKHRDRGTEPKAREPWHSAAAKSETAPARLRLRFGRRSRPNREKNI